MLSTILKNLGMKKILTLPIFPTPLNNDARQKFGIGLHRRAGQPHYYAGHSGRIFAVRPNHPGGRQGQQR